MEHPIKAEELRICYCEYVGKEPDMELINALAALMNMVFEMGKEAERSAM